MAYSKQSWTNGPGGGTPVSATRLGHMEDGIADAHDQLATAQVALGALPATSASLAGRAVAGRGLRLPPAALAGVTSLSPSYTGLLGMLADGNRKVFSNSGFNASQLGVSTDGVTFTWGKNLEGSNGIAVGFIETPGGEVLVGTSHRDNTPGKLWRSTGWNPATADATSWTAVLTASGAGVSFDGRWCLHQRSVAPLASARSGTIFVAEYGFHISEAATPAEAAIRVRMSVDDGVTWTAIFDLRNYNADTNAHIHGVAYDPWDDRVLVTVGDNANAGIYYCNGEDLGAPVWQLVPGTGGSSSVQATTLVPTATALVALSDSPISAVRRIPRKGYRGYAAIETSVTIATTGTAVIGAHAYQSDSNGPFLLSFYSSTSSGAPSIYATLDGKRFTAIHTEDASVTTGPGVHSVVGPDIAGRVWATKNMAGSGVLLTGNYAQSGVAAPAAGGGGVATTRQIATGEGITGGGDLSADRTLALAHGDAASRYGLISQMYPLHLSGGSVSTALTSGTVYVMRVVAENDAASASRTVRTYQIGAGSGLTLAKAAVFDATGNQVGVSADASATINTAGPTTRSISVGTFALIKGATYYVAFLVVGTTGPTIARTSNDSRTNAGLSAASLLWATAATAQTDMPATITPGSLAAQNLAIWFGLL